MSAFDRIGGDGLRRVLEVFYDRVFDDTMIGYLFWGKDKARLIEKEWEFTAGMLGADVKYTGKSMPRAHAGLHVLGGHFMRRQKILEEVLEELGVDAEVRRRWLEHNLALRPQVTSDLVTECND